MTINPTIIVLEPGDELELLHQLAALFSASGLDILAQIEVYPDLVELKERLRDVVYPNLP